MMGRQPNLFVLGAPKSGTTALCSYLAKHPDVFVCPIKEPHYYSTDFASSFKGNYRDYLSLFNDARPEQRWLVDGSTGHLRSDRAITGILADEPEARFIVMLRNPIEMAFSLHAERIRHFDEDVMSFREALDLEPARATGRNLPKDCPEPKLLQYRWFCRIGEQVSRAMDLIPPGRLHVVLFDDFERSPGNEYRRVLEFLGLQDDGQSAFERVNPRREFRWPVIEHGLRAVRRARARLGITRGLGIHARINRFNLRRQDAVVDPQIRRELARDFADDIYLLERCLGQDLSHWLKG